LGLLAKQIDPPTFKFLMENIIMTFKENIISRNERIVSTILRNINFTNKALSLIARVSISTIKR